MIPVKDVMDRTGRVLLGAGKEVSSKQIKTLRAWGITEVVVGEDSQASDEDAKKGAGTPKGSLEKKLAEVFRFTDQRHPAIKELFASCLERKSDT
ncbi:MAG: hypothetical protein IID18_04575 [Nitrospinae bacterium]|nr:hypothetical protein [Nitrospinota bacterium]